MTAPRWIGLQNVEVLHSRSPISFSIPRSDQRRRLKVGDLVKLVFEADRPSATGLTAERMWVEVRAIRDSTFVGALDNTPSFLSNLQPGELITFGPEHVAALQFSPSGLDLPFGLSAIASADLADGRAFPTEAYRESPSDTNSSGWVVLSESGSVGLVPMQVNDLIARFRILDSILDEPVGTRWRWDSDALEYVRGPEPSKQS
jgi:hypothetical protein